MRKHFLSPLRAGAERFLPAVFKDRLREALARRLEDRVVTFRQLAERSDTESWRFGEPWSVEFEEPTYCNDPPPDIKRLFGRHHCYQPFVVEVPDATVFGQNGFKMTAAGEYITFNFDRTDRRRDAARELAYEAVDEISRGNWPLSRPRGRNLPRRRVVTPLLHRWATNYSHWTEEWLTQVEGIRHYTQRTGRKPTLLIPPDPPSFIPESLAVLGFDDDDFVEWDGKGIIAERPVLPSIRRCRSDPTDDYLRDVGALKRLREEVLDSLSPAESKAGTSPNLLLISRQEDASTREIVNWSEVTAALEGVGFETVVLSELSYCEQKRRFAGAEVIVGTHGAGLTELIFAPDAGVIELFGDYVTPVYYEMATGLDMDYACLHCEDRGGDILVDVEELEAAIEAVTAGTGNYT